jgi:hypothetical protein
MFCRIMNDVHTVLLSAAIVEGMELVCVCSRDVITYVHRSSCKVPVIVDRFSKNTEVSNFIKICSVGAEMFDADGRTDMSK